MIDRIPTEILENGAIRYAEYDSAGNFVQYRYLLPADNPTQEGTPLNKGTLLSDATSAATGGSETVSQAILYNATVCADLQIKKKGFSTFELIQRGLI